jgi:hypothetical protein
MTLRAKRFREKSVDDAIAELSEIADSVYRIMCLAEALAINCRCYVGAETGDEECFGKNIGTTRLTATTMRVGG